MLMSAERSPWKNANVFVGFMRTYSDGARRACAKDTGVTGLHMILDYQTRKLAEGLTW